MAVDINGDGLIALGGTSATQGRLRLAEDTDNGTNYIELTAPASVASNRTITLPDVDGTVLTTGATITAAQGGTGLTDPGTNGNVLTSNGTAWVSQAISAGGNYVQQVYSSPATWTKPDGLKAVKVTVVGGGGNGGQGGGPTGSTVGSGGAGAGVAIEYLTAPAIPGPVAVTVGAAASTSSFGAFLSATGGSSGVPAGGINTTAGAGSGGQINLSGGWGGAGGSPVSDNTGSGGAAGGSDGRTGGPGGGGAWGKGAPGIIPVTPANLGAGLAAGGYGNGGSGGSGTAPSPRAGGAGSAGIVIVEEFY